MLTILNFSAAGCPPCRAFKPILDRIGQSHPVRLVDIGENPDLAQIYGVQSVPTTFVLKDGEIRWAAAGVVPEDKLRAVLRKYG